MTPKEKAQELIEKYRDADVDLTDSYYGKIDLGVLGAKECAKIAVDEMIDLLKRLYERRSILIKFDIDFLIKVKQEIEEY